MSKVYERQRDVLFAQVKGLYNTLLTEGAMNPVCTDADTRDTWARNFGNMIHDMPVIWSGSASKAAIDNKIRNSKYKPSKDHYNSRQRCGNEIVETIITCYGNLTPPTLRQIEMILNRARRVHYVTERENQRARTFMAKNVTPMQAYKSAGIKLVHHTQDLFSRKGRRSVQYKRDIKRKYG